MRIALDFRIVKYTRAGFFRYAQALIASLDRFPRRQARFFLLQHEGDDSLASLPAGMERVSVATPLFSPDEARALGREIEPLRLDAIHFPFSLFPGRLAPRVLLTVHDLTCARVPESIEERYLPFYRRALERATEADRIVAVSRPVAAELVAAGVPAGKVGICHPGTPFDDWMPAPGGRADAALLASLHGRAYLLCVGSFEPRKNHLAALDVFAEIRRRVREPVQLVLAGHHEWLASPFFDAVARHPHRDDVRLVRDASDATVRALMKGCRLFLNLSTYEGFCLPVLEALAEGACTLSTPVPSLEDSGFPPDGTLETVDAPAVAARVAHLLADAAARESLAHRARAAVGAFYRSRHPARFAELYGP